MLKFLQANIKLRNQIKLLKEKLNNIYKNNKLRNKIIHENGDQNALNHNKIENLDKYFKKFNYTDLKRYIKFSNSLKKTLNKFDVQFSNKRILDIGCGPGFVIKSLLKNSNFKEVMCVDSSKVAIQKLKEIFPEAKTMILNIVEDDFANLIDFDVIFCTEVIEHIPDYENVLEKIKNLMSDRTLFILTIPDGRLDQSMYHVNFFSKISLEVILKKIFTNFHFKLYNFNGSAICAILKKK
jgi:2-polyprenyl-3-methyl-5-hydroxy-6-metoxy-1,4-benzoquinol methylase